LIPPPTGAAARGAPGLDLSYAWVDPHDAADRRLAGTDGNVRADRQSAADPLVLIAQTLQLAKDWRAKGATVQFQEYDFPRCSRNSLSATGCGRSSVSPRHKPGFTNASPDEPRPSTE